MRIAIFLSLLFPSIVFAQIKDLTVADTSSNIKHDYSNCDYEVAEKDKFTKLIVLETKPVVFHNFWNKVSFSMKRNGIDRYLIIRYSQTGRTPLVLVNDSQILLLDSSGQVVKLIPIVNGLIDSGEYTYSKNGGYTVFKIFIPLTDAKYQELENYIPVGMRIYGSDNYIDIDKFKKIRNSDDTINFFKDHWECINRKAKSE